MSFGDHIEELRGSLIKALLWLVGGTLIGLFFGTMVVEYIKLPLEESLGNYYINQSISRFDEFQRVRQAAGMPVPYQRAQIEYLTDQGGYVSEIQYIYPPELFTGIEASYPGAFEADRLPRDLREEMPEGVERATVPDPTDETKKRELPGLMESDLVPILVWKRVENDPRASIKALGAQEAFMIWLKAGLMAGLIFSSPMVFYHLWSFVAAGLYPHEKKYVNIFLPFSVVLFLTGAAFCFFVVFPYVLDFLFTFNQTMGIDPDPRISEWLSFALILPIGFGLSFQLPLVMLFLERVGIFSIATYLAKWRISVLVIFVISMILTPADPISMMLMAVPLTFLYFGGIGLCKWMPRAKSPLDM